jgi:hypothetical protein
MLSLIPLAIFMGLKKDYYSRICELEEQTKKH